MHRFIALIASFALAGIASSAAAPQYSFSFTVRSNGDTPVSLSASVPPGTSHVLQATEHLKVTIETPPTTADSSMTIVKLIDDSSGKPVVLHTARRSGPVSLVRTFGYAVCEGRTTFQSPLRDAALECGH